MYHDTLDDIVESIQDGSDIPADLHDTSTTYIPKAEVLQDPELVRSTASTIRPITLINTAEQIFTIGINNDLAPVVDKCVSPAQRGFVQGRLIDADILGMNGAMAAMSLQAEAQGVGLLIDFAQAFPSLAHSWLSLSWTRCDFRLHCLTPFACYTAVFLLFWSSAVRPHGISK